MIQILNEAKKDFSLFKEKREKYSEKVNAISDELGLRGNAKLRSDFLPTYVVGNLKDGNYKYVLFGINPGFSEKNNFREEEFKSKNWEYYLKFIKYFFRWSEIEEIKYPYYRKICKILSKLDGLRININEELLDYCHKHVVGIELIPYHSKSFRLSDKLSQGQIRELKKRIELNFDLVQKVDARLVMFNGKIAEKLFCQIYPHLLRRYFTVRKIRVYYFEVNGKLCVLFDKFVTQPAFGLTNWDFEVAIPNKIRRFVLNKHKVL